MCGPRFCLVVTMPSTNPRYVDSAARARVRAIVRARIAAGEPCALCGQPIDLDAPQWYVDPKDGRRKRAPWSWEVDEIVPVSAGGSPYDAENVQPAHRLCNGKAGAKRQGKRDLRKPRAVAGKVTLDF